MDSRSPAYAFPMAQTFTLTAVPWLLPEGEFKGYLEYVTFIATDGGYTKKWSSTNIGTYAEDFAKILPPSDAQDVLERLRRGEMVLFPGLFELDKGCCISWGLEQRIDGQDWDATTVGKIPGLVDGVTGLCISQAMIGFFE